MPYRISERDPRERLLALIKGQPDPTVSSITSRTNKSTSAVTAGTSHTALTDMPSAINTDHDGRYHTKADLASVANGEGASLIGVEDAGELLTATDVEAALAELAAAAGSPADAQYVTLALDGDLSAERVLTAGDGISLTDGGANSTITVAGVMKRTGTVLTPATAGDTVELAQTSTTGSALEVTRDLAAASTDSAVVRIVQDNAGDDQKVVYIQQDGDNVGLEVDCNLTMGAIKTAIYGHCADTTDDVAAIKGIAEGASGKVHGIWGRTNSSNNAAYGGEFDCTKVGTWADFDERSSAASPPAAVPPAGDGRLYCVNDDTFTFVNSDGMAYGYSDQDHDTKIQVEEGDDEDKVRIDTGGTERLVMDATSARFSTPVGATTKYIIDGTDGIDSASIVFLTDFQAPDQVKYRTATWEGGILTAMSAESAWTAAPLNP